MKKLFMAFLAVATIAMVGCKDDKKDPTPTPTPGGGGEEPEIEIPEIAAPGAGKTTIAFYAEVCPKGAYLVGQSTPAGWNEKDDQTSFEAVQGAENWYAVTIDYAGDLEVKAIARPSDDDVALSWSYQWGMNFDPEDKNCTLPEGTENTKILKGDAEIKLGNGGEVALINLADNGVVYVQVKAWKTTPIIPNIPLEVAWIKTDWDGGDDNTGWEWKEMTAKGNGVFEYVGTWGGKGININGVGEDLGCEWYPDGDPRVTKQEGAKTGDEIKFTFTSVKGAIGTLKMDIVSAAPDPEPQPEKDITVKAKVPASWTNTITAWVWPTGGEGEAVTPEKSGDWYVVTKHCSELNIIFRNGTDWAGDVNQTVDLKAAENTCWELASDGATKATATSVDCE
jgi:hypothetical protein